MAPKRKPVQKTLGAFGFTKKVFHRGKFTHVERPDEPKVEFKLNSTFQKRTRACSSLEMYAL